jgi:hypothetical protein
MSCHVQERVPPRAALGKVTTPPRCQGDGDGTALRLGREQHLTNEVERFLVGH